MLVPMISLSGVRERFQDEERAEETSYVMITWGGLVRHYVPCVLAVLMLYSSTETSHACSCFRQSSTKSMCRKVDAHQPQT